MPRRIGYPLMSGAVAALAWAWWPAAPAGLATAIRRLDVTVTVLILAGLPWLVRRFFGPGGRGRAARAVRAGGYAVVVAVVLVKAAVEWSGYTGLDGVSRLAGVWAGEIVFLIVLAVYVTGILTVTAQRPPIHPPALVIGIGAGLAAGVIMYALPPIGGLLHVTGWLGQVYGAARVLAVLAVLASGVAAGMTAARRASKRGSKLSLADVRARQGVATGLCAGAAAALVVCVLGIGTAAFVPQALDGLRWAMASPHLTPTGLYAFEISLTDTAAGHLLVLVVFPVFGAGLGAWGGLCAADRPGQLPDEGGGGGGHGPPTPPPRPPGGGRRLHEERPPPAILDGGYLVDLPAVPGLPGAGDDADPAPARPVTIPAGTASRR